MNTKKTKIICTIGPASSSKNKIMQLVQAGMNTARLNFSHGTHETHQEIFENIRQIEQKIGRPIGILADLQGPKIRTTGLRVPPFLIKPNDTIWLNDNPEYKGDQNELGCTYPHIIKDLKVNDKLMLDDGKLVFSIIKKSANKVMLKAINGGMIHEFKGINLPGTKISAPALTEKDLKDLKFAKKLGVDYVALSFVRQASDIELVKKLSA